MSEKILVVDDDLETLKLIGMMLQKQGFQVIAANNGKQGMELAISEKPDLVVLDVMMQDVDGFSVTRQLRSNPETIEMPILIFTAKSQVDDKVTGYEAGADDYITKPVHPAELVAHIKALLARRKPRTETAPTQSQNGYMIGVIGAKGGLGTSTVTLNLGTALYDKTKAEIICAELRPGNGTWGVELGFSDTKGLSSLASKPIHEIDEATVKENLVPTSFGPRLLLSSPRIVDIDLKQHITQIESIIQQLPKLASMIILDLGTSNYSIANNFLKNCQELIIVTESQPVSIQRTRILMEELNNFSFGKNKPLHILTVNRLRSDMQVTQTQIQEKLGVYPVLTIPPAPELSYQAAVHFQPMIRMQPESLVTQQYLRLADHFTGHL